MKLMALLQQGLVPLALLTQEVDRVVHAIRVSAKTSFTFNNKMTRNKLNFQEILHAYGQNVNVEYAVRKGILETGALPIIVNRASLTVAKLC